ncbi:putative glycosomal membrane protein [Trypanosoma cruzi]|uniref:Glycosomal membrane protein, putative n=2 Tax=Trypanosoma cruzi TaxID=5693 RepID=Q4CYY9_TRYCC|nr:glycosomal membrane protein, putative [Trypanosoma cruzi]EAN85491.1 glycosomal membrane protein, putative [Trypanosoma cruzi]PWV19180.1 putative glycosomal membrane protein [Trypanosoma cruzi]RNC47812.1 glycosomal membrane protein [Trypanosoma cruzi]|eukprot:XP_807342.1 glycosomal membrane protein [Trypanosoma cruzi strain CL Brener]
MSQKRGNAMEVAIICLESADMRDKVLKGVGALAKLGFCLMHDKSLLDFADATSEVRSLMRILAWLSNIQTIYSLLNKEQCGVRDLIFLVRVVGEGVFKAADNVAFLGRKVHENTPFFQRFSYASCLGLFWAHLAAVALALFDIRYDRLFSSRRKQFINLFLCTCDLLTAAAGAAVFGFELNFIWFSLLTLISSFLGCVDGVRSAAIVARRRGASRSRD